MSYYIISLKHTNKEDKYFTLWRADNADYCLYKHFAGVYTEYEKGYHDSFGNIPVESNLCDSLFTEIEYKGNKIYAILNNAKNRKLLGITKRQLGK